MRGSGSALLYTLLPPAPVSPYFLFHPAHVQPGNSGFIHTYTGTETPGSFLNWLLMCQELCREEG